MKKKKKKDSIKPQRKINPHEPTKAMGLIFILCKKLPSL